MGYMIWEGSSSICYDLCSFVLGNWVNRLLLRLVSFLSWNR